MYAFRCARERRETGDGLGRRRICETVESCIAATYTYVHGVSYGPRNHTGRSIYIYATICIIGGYARASLPFPFPSCARLLRRRCRRAVALAPCDPVRPSTFSPTPGRYQRCSSVRLRPHLAPAHPRAEHAAPAVEHDEVRVCARAQRALATLDPEALRGVVRRAAQRLAERAAREAREVAHALVERHHAAQESARSSGMEQGKGKGKG